MIQRTLAALTLTASLLGTSALSLAMPVFDQNISYSSQPSFFFPSFGSSNAPLAPTPSSSYSWLDDFMTADLCSQPLPDFRGMVNGRWNGRLCMLSGFNSHRLHSFLFPF